MRIPVPERQSGRWQWASGRVYYRGTDGGFPPVCGTNMNQTEAVR
jgi:hypothetical protein